MNETLIDKAMALMRGHRYSEANILLRRVIHQDPTNWYSWYISGQCCRFSGDIDDAINHLTQASKLKSDVASVYLALGIAYQLNTQWEEAIEVLKRAIELDPDYDLAYNSLALTQRKSGEFEKALHNYDAAAKALSRRLCKELRNSTYSTIFKHRDTIGTLWIEYVTYTAIYLASSTEGIKQIAWLTGEQALEEERTEKHKGLYWIDQTDDEGEMMRLFLPNFFNTFQRLLRRDPSYSNIIGNRSTVLELLGRNEEAQAHLAEAKEFSF